MSELNEAKTDVGRAVGRERRTYTRRRFRPWAPTFYRRDAGDAQSKPCTQVSDDGCSRSKIVSDTFTNVFIRQPVFQLAGLEDNMAYWWRYVVLHMIKLPGNGHKWHQALQTLVPLEEISDGEVEAPDSLSSLAYTSVFHPGTEVMKCEIKMNLTRKAST